MRLYKTGSKHLRNCKLMYPNSIFLTWDKHSGLRHPKSSGIEPTFYITALCQGQTNKNLGYHHQQKIFHMVLNSWPLSIMYETQDCLLCSPLTLPRLATMSLIHHELLLKPPSLNWMNRWTEWTHDYPCNSAESAELCVDFNVTSKIFYYFKSWGNINTFCEEGKHQINYHFIL